MKFGGTSVGSAQRMKEVASLICDGDQKIVALSAMSGTTNTLVEIADYLYKKNPVSANEVINKMEQKYAAVVEELYSKEEPTKAIDTKTIGSTSFVPSSAGLLITTIHLSLYKISNLL